MRTTIVLDDAVFQLARKRATALKTSMSALIEAALRSELAARPKVKGKRFKLVVNKGPGLAPGLTWSAVASAVLGGDVNGLP